MISLSRLPRLLLLCGALSCATGCLQSPSVAQAPDNSRLITDFDKNFTYSYLSWKDKPKARGGQVTISSPDGRGGAGINQGIDLTGLEDYSPALVIKTNPGNTAKEIRLSVTDTNKTTVQFAYVLPEIGGDFAVVLPKDALAFSALSKGKDPGKSLDLSSIQSIQVVGDFKPTKVEVTFDKIVALPPTDAILAERDAAEGKSAAATEKARLKAEELAAAREAALKNPVTHAPTDPDISHVAPVAPDILAITIRAGAIAPVAPVPYKAQPEDTIETGKKEKLTLAQKGSEIAQEPDTQTILRPIPQPQNKKKGKPKFEKLGDLVIATNSVLPPETLEGAMLNDFTADAPQAYQLTSPDDAFYRAPRSPAAIYRKSKPLDGVATGNDMVVENTIFLKLAQPLQAGATYKLSFPHLNTRQAEVSYTHQPAQVRSEAVHTTQIGYRPSDPFKRAYLSTWLGTGGALAYDQKTFALLDDKTGKQVYEGPIQLSSGPNDATTLRDQKNYDKTGVYTLDFSAFKTPGSYRVYVPNVGTSYPVRIGDDVWREAFQISMQGLLTQRNGIALGPPFTDYKRPRTFTDDDRKFYQLDITRSAGQEGARGAALTRLWKAGKLQPVTGIYGGYQDAGDWDSYSTHIDASLLALELLELYPAYFEKTKLSLPPAEANNTLPDVMDEALWNLASFRRLQLPDGGVRGGYGDGYGARGGETSWTDTQVVGVYAPDVETSVRYAAAAAKAARLLKKYDAAQGREYAQSAVKAWNWAQANPAPAGSKEAKSVMPLIGSAAVELYHLTGEAAYHQAFKDTTALLTGGDPVRERDALFSYALLPDNLADAALKRKAVEALVQAADKALVFSQGNAFNLATAIPTLPLIGYVGYYTVPEMASGPLLPRVYYLTKDEKYLSGSIAATQFSAGANPMNTTMTTGVGYRWPTGVLHLDSRRSGQATPKGITVYGPSDPAKSEGYLDWAHNFFLSRSMTPNSRTWPASEFYVGLYKWPAMNEYTVAQTIAPTAYAWGSLAARQ